MEFIEEGKKISVHGDPSLTRHACGRADLRSLKGGDEAWFLWALEYVGVISFLMLPSFSIEQQEELTRMLLEFPSVMQTPSGLPPSRRGDHRIILHEGVSPFLVHPYRYNHS